MKLLNRLFGLGTGKVRQLGPTSILRVCGSTSERYDLPAELLPKNPSPAFEKFRYHWFQNTWGLTRGDVDLLFLADLNAEELHIARSLVRRNLALGQTHFIEGAAELGDLEAVPILRSMLTDEADLSRRLTIAGGLWRLARDESFPTLLREMAASDRPTLRQAHHHQILWLEDQRTIELLIDLLDDRDSFVRHLSLSALNRIEHQGGFLRSAEDMAMLPDYYRSNRSNPDFRKRMVQNLFGKGMPAALKPAPAK